MKELREFGSPEMVVVLVGNKSDLGQWREVKLEDGQSLAQLEEVCFMETSAKENMNVEEAFVEMITRIYEISSSHKRVEANKVSEDQATINPSVQTLVQGKKEIIFIDEVSATKQTSRCCSHWTINCYL